MMYPNIRCYICGGKVSFGDKYVNCLDCGYILSDLEDEKDFHIEPEDVKEKLDDTDVIVLDVREPLENQTSKLPNSILIPLGQVSNRYSELDKNKKIVVYCHHGLRSFHATRFLIQKGFNAKNIYGGIHNYSNLDPSIPKYNAIFTGTKLIVRKL